LFIVSQKVTHVTSHHPVIKGVLKMSASSTSATALTLVPLAKSTFNNRVTQSVPLTVDASFQFVDI